MSSKQPVECPCAGCGRPVTSKGLCGTHYARAKKGADLTAPVRAYGQSKDRAASAPVRPSRPHQECSAPECGRAADSKGMCDKHYRQSRRPPSKVKPPPQECSAGCGRVAKVKGLCPAHYAQLRTRGYLSDFREIRVPNRVAVDGASVRIVLTGVEGEEVGATIIDVADLAEVSAHRWRSHRAARSSYRPYDARPYARAHGIGGLDAFLLKPPPGFEVDHINGDTLDNRRANLKVVPFRDKACPSKWPSASPAGSPIR